jgi:hypothetical protein
VAAALLRDRLALESGEARRAGVDSVQHRERQRQHDEVGGDVGGAARALERERVAAAGGPLQTGQLLAELDDARTQRLGHPVGQLLVAPADVKALVRLAEDGQLVLVRLEGQEVDEVERGLVIALGAVLDVVGDVEELAERRTVPARHARLDPVEDAHVVELDCGVGEAVERGGERRRSFVGRDGVEDRREVGVGLGLRIEVPVEVECVGGAGRLRGDEVVELEVEAPRELPDVGVAGVDELSAPLGHLVVGPGGVVGEHAPSGAGRGLVDGGRNPAVGQAHRAGEPRDARPHDDDLGVVVCCTDHAWQGENACTCGGAGEHVAACDAARGAQFTDCFEWYLVLAGQLVVGVELSE